MRELQQFLGYSYLGNTVLRYLFFLICFAAGVALLKTADCLLKKRFERRLKDGKILASGDTITALLRKNLMPVLYLAAFRLSTGVLNLNPVLDRIIEFVTISFTIVVGAVVVSSVAVFFVEKYVKGKVVGENSNILLKWMSGIVKAVVWSIALLLFLDNVGVKITSLVTGLGIGGIALAFAAQSILADIFCCFTILFDKPFEIGDFIIAGDHMGTVEHVGMKTTRLRALNGEQIVISNSDLTNSRISNFRTMKERRVLFRIGVTYDTPHDKLKRIPALIKDIVDGVQDVRFGRAHFCSYGPYSLEFEIAYYVLSGDYDKYLDVNHEINCRIKEEFEAQGIEFAFPTQTIHLFSPSRQTCASPDRQ